MGKPYTLLEVRPDGTEVRQYENGDIRDQNGRMIVPLHGQELGIITPENARLRHQQRKEKILNAIEQNIMKVTRTNVPAEAIAHIVGKRAEIAMTDNTRVGNEASRIVLQALDAYQDKQQETIQTQRHEYVIDDDTMRVIERMIAVKRDESDGYTK